jgi:hypothetical protein
MSLRLDTHSESGQVSDPNEIRRCPTGWTDRNLRRRLITKLFLRPVTGAKYHGGCPKKKRGSLYRITLSYGPSLGGRFIDELHWVRKGTDAP